MKIKKQNKSFKQKKYALFTILSLSVSTGIFWLQNSNADNSITQIEEVNSENTENQKKIDELQKRAVFYLKIIDIKKKQRDSLNNQLSITDSNIDKIQTQINATSQQIDDYNSQIIRLGAQIKEKQTVIDSQKKLLSDLVKSFYTMSQSNLLNLFLTDENFAGFLVNKDHVAQAGDKIKELVDSVTEMKKGLQAESAALDMKKVEVVNAQQKLQDQNEDLQSVKDQRMTLLKQTKGEEALYSKLLQRVEEQKQELLDIDQYYSASGLSVDSYPKPDVKYFASTSWFFSQRDPRWADETIGNTKTLMKSYGCAVTAVAMVFKEHGCSIDPGKLSSAPIFSGDLINWPDSWNNPQVVLTSSGKSHGNINWTTIDEQLAKGHPVIVYIGRTKGAGGHYVVIHHKESLTGKYVVHDPYFGPNLYLDTSRALVGSMGTPSPTSIDQMIIYN